MRTHVTGLAILGVCGALLAVNTMLFLSGNHRAVVLLTAVFGVLVLLVALLIAVLPAVANFFSG